MSKRHRQQELTRDPFQARLLEESNRELEQSREYESRLRDKLREHTQHREDMEEK